MLGGQIVVIDASVLINFLHVDRIDVLRRIPDSEWIVTDHVRDEVRDGVETQVSRYESALAAGSLRETRVDQLGELKTFADLLGLGLGRGESATLAVAIHRKWIAALDDRTAIKKARRSQPMIQTVRTEDIVRAAIVAGALTVEEADVMKADWETEYRFRLRFRSFEEILQSDDRSEAT